MSAITRGRPAKATAPPSTPRTRAQKKARKTDGSENAGQAAVNLSFSQRQSADEAIVITDTDGKVVFVYDPDKDEVAEGNARWYSGAILSAPGLSVGGEYYISVGGDVEGEEVAGVYDPDSVTGFTTDAKQQCWTGTGTLGGFGGGGGGSTPAAAMAALTRMAGTPPVRARSCLASAKK